VKQALQVAFFALVLAALAQALWQHDRLPDRVATHFGAAGQANGWMSRGGHTAWHVGTVLFLASIIEGIILVHARLPKEFINLPQRDFWLAPERATATREWITSAVLLIGCALMGFFIALFQLVYEANLGPAPRLDGTVWWLVGGLTLLMSAVIAALVVKFGRKPTA
jgi:serine/threonine-protein kinase